MSSTEIYQSARGGPSATPTYLGGSTGTSLALDLGVAPDAEATTLFPALDGSIGASSALDLGATPEAGTTTLLPALHRLTGASLALEQGVAPDAGGITLLPALAAAQLALAGYPGNSPPAGWVWKATFVGQSIDPITQQPVHL
jgi:hypothetical protein